jgi:hypothetical protein
MSNWIDRIEEWAARQPSESLGEYYFRALIAILYIGLATGVMGGFVLVPKFMLNETASR